MISQIWKLKKITTNILRSVLFLPARYSNKPNLTEAYLVILPTSLVYPTSKGMIHPHRCPKKTSGGRGWWWWVDRWAAVGEFFPWIKRKTGKLKHLEMIDWDWDWIWDWDRLDSVSNYLPRPELIRDDFECCLSRFSWHTGRKPSRICFKPNSYCIRA